jgi:hypothetical protein
MPFSNPLEAGRPVRILDEGVTLVSSVDSIDFTGAGVTGTAVGRNVTETIPGSTATGDVVGPVSATDTAIALFDGATGKLLKEGALISTLAPKADPTFTGTDVTVGGGATVTGIKLLEPSGSGANFSRIVAQAQGADITYMLPSTVGGAGTYLKDAAGDGVLSWGSPASNYRFSQVRVASTANVTVSTLNAGDAIDGITVSAGDKVLLKDQTAGAENGIYVVAAAAGNTVRATDYDSDDEIRSSVVLAMEGTANGLKVFQNANTSAINVGVTSISYFFDIGNQCNSETLSGNKTLTASDCEWQFFNCSGADRTVTLPTAATSVGKRFVIVNASTGIPPYKLLVSPSVDSLNVSLNVNYSMMTFVNVAGTWHTASPGITGGRLGTKGVYLVLGNNIGVENLSQTAEASGSVLIGYGNTGGNTRNVNIGNSQTTSGNADDCIAIGNSIAKNTGILIGVSTTGATGATVIGKNASANAKTNAKVLSASAEFASAQNFLEYYEKLNTYNGSSNYAWASRTGGYLSTANATPTEMYIREFSSATGKQKLAANYAMRFLIDVIAMEMTNKTVKVWQVCGQMKRVTDTTTIVGELQKTVIHEDAGAELWDFTVTADDTNDAPTFTCTGDSSRTTVFSASMNFQHVGNT